MWNATISGIDSGIDYTVEKSKVIGEKWDNSSAGSKVNSGAKVAVEKTKDIGSAAIDKTKAVFGVVASNEKVQAIG